MDTLGNEELSAINPIRFQRGGPPTRRGGPGATKKQPIQCPLQKDGSHAKGMQTQNLGQRT